MSGWCKKGCLDCTKPHMSSLKKCTGFTPKPAKPCMSEHLSNTANIGIEKMIDSTDDISIDDTSESTAEVSTNEMGESTDDVSIGDMGESAADGSVDEVGESADDFSIDDMADSTTHGACSAADKKHLEDPNTVGKKQDACGHSAYSIIHGMDEKKFVSCVKKSLKISDGCAKCYFGAADYGAKHCKMKCMSGWCKKGCLDCTKPHMSSLKKMHRFHAEACKTLHVGALVDQSKHRYRKDG